jgi:hypothetical protein
MNVGKRTEGWIRVVILILSLILVFISTIIVFGREGEGELLACYIREDTILVSFSHVTSFLYHTMVWYVMSCHAC